MNFVNWHGGHLDSSYTVDDDFNSLPSESASASRDSSSMVNHTQ